MQFKYNFLSLLRSRSYIFWALAFPLALATFFNFAFSGDAITGFSPIPIAIVQEDGAATAIFNDILHQLAYGDNAIVEIITTGGSMYEAESLLAGGTIEGIFILSNEVGLKVSATGVRLFQSILQTIAHEFTMNFEIISNVMANQPHMLAAVVAQLAEGIDVNQATSPIGTNLVIYHFYVLLAMVCFMGAQAGVTVATSVQARTSALAARRSVAPTSKLSLVTNAFLSTIIFQVLAVFITLFYVNFILGINFGDQIPLLLLACLVGSIVGVSFGMFIGTIVKGSENIKVAVVTAISFVLYAASGLFSSGLRIMVRDALPIADRINPMTLLSDAFVSLVIFDDFSFFFQTLAILMATSVGFVVLSAAILRRSRYADS